MTNYLERLEKCADYVESLVNRLNDSSDIEERNVLMAQIDLVKRYSQNFCFEFRNNQFLTAIKANKRVYNGELD